jgi:Arm DNA-binding domain
MARKIYRLTALKIEKIKKSGYYADGADLWLQVTATGAKSWILRFMHYGREREMGLGLSGMSA